ncbi:lipopolysaccharide transport periplasmic protein LptA [Helicobacter sp. 11S02596-1]|uniref:lipopolysaccharide transport periplasmic protein LptA n=1 Tax=Helicobacter sp. 11S02596-1 TaxID=1476194 RepID=UPI000BA6DEDD|nr:lipopolysaccharide transport periplasmic protein LptA [Helicobacter sp. 11S02596-1]PAF42794.1 lipopolysaccharide transport periplasmic protein LptA [Helicobacter sp. 11S02596-1]
MKAILWLFCLSLGVIAFGQETLEVTANKFLSNDAKGIMVIEGDVHIKKAKDTLEADKVIIYSDKKRKPQFYEAQGNVKFHIFMEDGREFKGHSDKLTYNAQNGEYRLLENALVNEVGKSNTIRGEEIIVNNENGYANILGSKNKPAKFIFNLDEMDQKDTTPKNKQTPPNPDKDAQ